MQDSVGPSLAALRRKLRALTALTQDRGATPSERANAAVLKRQLEERLRQAGAPAGDWTDRAFRLGRWTKEMRCQSGVSAAKVLKLFAGAGYMTLVSFETVFHDEPIH